jgi:hypothetical protein
VALAPPECDVVSLGKQKGFSISADPDDLAEFVDSVRRMVRDPQQTRKMEKAAVAAASEYDREQELRKLVAVVESAIRSNAM